VPLGKSSVYHNIVSSGSDALIVTHNVCWIRGYNEMEHIKVKQLVYTIHVPDDGPVRPETFRSRVLCKTVCLC
jgi:hypothetical protein